MKKYAQAVEIGKNFLLRLATAFLSTGVRQFFTLPVLLAIFGKEVYGTILTINSVANIVEVCLGNTLNNTRLVNNSLYEEKGYEGDFNGFALIAAAIGTVAAVVLPFVFPFLNWATGLMMWLVIVLGIWHSYYTVGLTMRLKFQEAFVHSLFIAAGTLVGVGLTKLTGLWPFAFLMGHVVALILLFIRTPLMREKLRWTPLVKVSAKKWGTLTATSALANAMVYLDRLLLYPVLGAGAVAVYTTASFFGKCVAALIQPASNVFLAYISQKDFKMSRKIFTYITGASVAFCGVCLLASLLLAPWITGLFYPSLLAEAAPFFVLANTAAMIAAAGTMVQAIVLRFCNASKLLYTQIIYSIVYLGGGLLVLAPFGITGFCWVAIAANTVRLLTLIFYGYKKVGQKS